MHSPEPHRPAVSFNPQRERWPGDVTPGHLVTGAWEDTAPTSMRLSTHAASDGCCLQSAPTHVLPSAFHSPSDASTSRAPSAGTAVMLTSGTAMMLSLASAFPTLRVMDRPPGYTRSGPCGSSCVAPTRVLLILMRVYPPPARENAAAKQQRLGTGIVVFATTWLLYPSLTLAHTRKQAVVEAHHRFARYPSARHLNAHVLHGPLCCMVVG